MELKRHLNWKHVSSAERAHMRVNMIGSENQLLENLRIQREHNSKCVKCESVADKLWGQAVEQEIQKMRGERK